MISERRTALEKWAKLWAKDEYEGAVGDSDKVFCEAMSEFFELIDATMDTVWGTGFTGKCPCARCNRVRAALLRLGLRKPQQEG